MWVECVPNFSEGRRREVLDRLAAAVERPGVALLGMTWDADHHRSVITLAGEGDEVLEAVYQAALAALEHIDLRQHRGTHPRMGAVDVIPFVPLGQTPMAHCVALAERLGERLGGAGVPVYLYEAAARREDRRDLAAVRRGQFEGLEARMATPAGRPDFGPGHPHPSAGAVAIGARPPLIAFNVYLGSEDPVVARAIARAIRGSSGGLRGVKALGMHTQGKGMVQVSMNLVDYRNTPLPVVVEMIRREAARWGVAVAGSEIVGFVPEEALWETARYYLQLRQSVADVVLERALRRALGTGQDMP